MKTSFLKRRLASTSSALVLLAAVVLGGWCLAPEGRSQAPAASISVSALIPLVTKLKVQQAQIAANQTKIEAQTAVLKENIRQAKIYSARAGAAHR